MTQCVRSYDVSGSISGGFHGCSVGMTGCTVSVSVGDHVLLLGCHCVVYLVCNPMLVESCSFVGS